MDKEPTTRQSFEERRIDDIAATKELLTNPDLSENDRIMHQHELIDYEHELHRARMISSRSNQQPSAENVSRFTKFGRFIRGNTTWL